jgi:exosortase/archaeosortase family protein
LERRRRKALIERVAAVLLLLLTVHALLVHAEAGELSPWEVVVLEVLWVPILLKAPCDRRALLVVFAGYSGYFLPRLIPPQLFVDLVRPDILFNNVVLAPLGVKLVEFKDKVVILFNGRPYAFYAVGCSTLRSGPFLALMPLAARGSWKRRLLAAVTGYALSFPFNALRVASIILVGEVFHLGPYAAHIVASPIMSLIVATIIMVVQELILPGYLDQIADGVDCLIKLATPSWLSRSTSR